MKPCYPGACNAYCECSEGFGGPGCRNCEYTMTYFYFTCLLFTVIILYIGGRRGIVVVGFTTNKTNRHNIAEILLKVASNTIMLTIIYICIYIEEKTIGFCLRVFNICHTSPDRPLYCFNFMLYINFGKSLKKRNSLLPCFQEHSG